MTLANSVHSSNISSPVLTRTGRGVRVAIIDSGVNSSHPHVGGVTGGVRIGSEDPDKSNDYVDYLGHGTAVAAAIREKAPEAHLYAVKVFDRSLTTNIDVIIDAIDWCSTNGIDVINLSLGTLNPDHRDRIEQAVARTAKNNAILVAAREMAAQPSFPGCLPGVIGVVADWNCSRDTFQTCGDSAAPVFVASAYPREIPGVPRERNLNGTSFAVANMTGFVARAREFAPRAPVDELKQLLVEAWSE